LTNCPVTQELPQLLLKSKRKMMGLACVGRKALSSALDCRARRFAKLCGTTRWISEASLHAVYALYSHTHMQFAQLVSTVPFRNTQTQVHTHTFPSPAPSVQLHQGLRLRCSVCTDRCLQRSVLRWVWLPAVGAWDQAEHSLLGELFKVSIYFLIPAQHRPDFPRRRLWIGKETPKRQRNSETDQLNIKL
jgi:hypothetical protein